jgi:hypothetical protein
MSILAKVGLGAAALAALLAAVTPRDADAWPFYLDAWQAKYPTSTLPARMGATLGLECFVCHAPPNYLADGTCYRNSLRELVLNGLTIEQALDAADGMDSDGDGVAIGVEILTARADLAGHIGYHPGLIGPRGTGPCNADPSATVTGKPETPPRYPNCDGSTAAPALNVADFSCFLQRYAVGDPWANCDGSVALPSLNVADFTCYLQKYAGGCP